MREKNVLKALTFAHDGVKITTDSSQMNIEDFRRLQFNGKKRKRKKKKRNMEKSRAKKNQNSRNKKNAIEAQEEEKEGRERERETTSTIPHLKHHTHLKKLGNISVIFILQVCV